MNNVIHLSEIIETLEDGQTEICANADAEYDSSAAKVSVSLDAFARRVVAAGDGHHFSETWLPRAEVVTEHLSWGEAADFARDVFHSWTRKVKNSVPFDVQLRV